MKTLPPRPTKALTLPELVIVLGCLTIFVFMILPELLVSRSNPTAQRINCTNNLKQIGLSFRTWALDHNDEYPMSTSVTNGGTMEVSLNLLAYTSTEVMSNELSTPKMLICTEDKSRMAATNFRSIGGRNLSYFVGVDATQTSPKMFLSGDDNLLVNGVPARPGLLILTTNSAIAWSQRRHGGQGNVALADGSVQQFSPERLTEALRNTGAVTNRILLP